MLSFSTPLLFYLLTILLGFNPIGAEFCSSSLCEFNLVVSMQQSLVYNPPESPPGYFDVDLVGEELRIVNSTFRPTEIFPEFIGQAVPDDVDIITLDGVKRNIFTVNGKFPAPTLEVPEGAMVVVHVKNMLSDKELTIHWHGLPQRTNAWMDGVPQVTQCAIPTGHSFTYRFRASPAGTFWYHSHLGYQRTDGIAGFLIIHASPPTLPYFPVLLQDWYHKEGHIYWFSNPLATPPVAGSGSNLWSYFAPGYTPFLVDGSDITLGRYVSGLINGRGRFNKDKKWMLSTFEVKKGVQYLFRVANVGAQYPLQFSVDGHSLIVVALDGLDVDPLVVDSVIMYPAERADIVIVANQPVGSYWMRSRVPKDDSQDGVILETLGVVSYVGSKRNTNPTSVQKVCTSRNPCKVFNCPFKYYPSVYHSTCVHMADVKRTYRKGQRAQFGLTKVKPDVEYFLNLNFNKGAAFNAQNFVPPTTPLYQTDSRSVNCDVCSNDAVCNCTTKLHLPFNKIIQLVISNINPSEGPVQTHSIHVHGHHFAVVRQGYPDYIYGAPAFSLSKTPNADIVCNDLLCRHARWAGNIQPTLNLRNPPLKDTTIVPASGYSVFRFVSNNPGPWLVHCHMQHHLAQGPMSFLLMEAEDRFPPVPPSMPTCSHNFSLSHQQYSNYERRARKALAMGGGFRKISPF